MLVHKPHNKMPKWLHKLGEKLSKGEPGQQNTFLEDDLVEVWSRIETTLASRKKPLSLVVYKRLGAYAAGVLLLLGCGLGVYRMTIGKREGYVPIPSSSEIAETMPVTPKTSASSSLDSASQNSAMNINTESSRSNLLAQVNLGEKVLNNCEREAYVRESNFSEEIKSAHEVGLQSKDVTDIEHLRSNQTSQSNETVQEGKICETLVTVEKPEMVGEMQYYDGGEKENPNSLSRLTFASQSNVTPYFDSSNASNFSENTNPIYRLSASRKSYVDEENIPSIEETSVLRYDNAIFKHQLPFVVGGRVAIPIFQKFTVETGIRYTLLTSKVDHYDPGRRLTQRVHYLGLPFAVNMEVYRYGRLSFYTGVELGIDKAVASRLEEKSLDVLPWQFSLGAGVSIALSILPQLSIYFSPGVFYYFKDGTSLNTFYKDHPLNFNFSLGVRVTPFTEW